MREKPVPVIVLAGGRIHGEYAAATGTEVKAVVSVGDRPCVTRVVEALHTGEWVGRMVVVGPEVVREALPEGCPWVPESDSAYENVRVGLEALGHDPQEQVLLCGADVPCLSAPALDDFILRSPVEGEFCLPVVRREHFQSAFPGSENIYVRLREGHFTGGSQYLIQPRSVLENEPILRELVRQRKSQIGMVKTFGIHFILKLVTGRLTIPELERRASELTRSHCRAVPDCEPELAFDIDNLRDRDYLDRRLRN